MTRVVISGASSGIGAAAARRFARGGAEVVLVARRRDKLEALAAEIGDGARVFACDASDAEAVGAMARDVLASGPPDVVINAAGAGQWKTLLETTPEEARAMMDAPYFAAFFVTRAFLPAMLEARRGIVMHLNSPACRVTWPESVGYAAARHALEGFHEALSQDLHGTGVTSCHVILGEVASDYWQNNPGAAERMPAMNRLFTTLSPEESADILWRLSRAPRHTSIHPLSLRIALALGRPVPGLMRWLARM